LGAPPDPLAFEKPDHYHRACEAHDRFNQSCTLIVKDEMEMQKAMEGGWRESPSEAVTCLIERDKLISRQDAHREYEDRNMSEAARAEVAAVKDARGGEPVPEKVEERKSKPSYKKTYSR
jgi:hypothetical protein